MPNLHSLHVSLIPLNHTALSALFTLPYLLYLELTVDDPPPPPQRTEDEVRVWLQMSSSYREWEKRWRLGRMGISEEEEEEGRLRLRAREVEDAKRRRWVRLKRIEEGEWDEALEEEFMNDEEDEEGEGEGEEEGGRGGGLNEAAQQYEGQVLAVWQQLFYLDRLRDGDHQRQAHARTRWRERQREQAQAELRRQMAEEAEEEEKGLQVTDLVEGEEVDEELDELQMMDEMREGRARRVKQSPIVKAAVPSMEVRDGVEQSVGEGGEDWENVPL